MPFIDWTEDFSVKNPAMDQQHQMLFEYINDYYQAVESDRETNFLLKVLDKIINYTAFHFDDEEKLMAQKEYPMLPRHKLIHEKLVREILDYRSQLEQDTAGIRERIQLFLKNWLTAHIKGIDRQYSAYL